MKTLILGMGNTLLSDDGIGILIKRNLERYIDDENIELTETNWGGFRIIDLLKDHDTAFIIDAIKTCQKPAGYIYHLKPKDLLHTLRLNSYHDINFITAIQLGNQLNVKMPKNIFIYAVEIIDNMTISESIDPILWKSIKLCSKEIIIKLNHLNTSKINPKITDEFSINTPYKIKELYKEQITHPVIC